ncbi:stage II sporulation protein P [Clostridium sp. SHJSY1]|uniref:stage II sporulation protein P n=1 Tax=Clostridium sp. SHJSY1 TaxID=2942483 RepID=UPI0028745B93|nr:stage II sporulation protein P [Clostridium sp. SHJSY1]MDS0524069.1 stage II sporulation protein P [Clostridium sp. SHJSY1]
MYKQNIRRKDVKQNINIGVIILLIVLSIFSYRVINILRNSKERGGFAYVQLLNFGMPIVENQIYDEGAYAENKLSIKEVCLEATGLKNINCFAIVNNEVSFFSQGFKPNDKIASTGISPFEINDSSIVKVDNNENKTTNDSGSNNQNRVDTKASPAYNPKLKKNLDNSKPEVLIYHSHTTENYAETGGDTLDENYSVVGVGSEIGRILEEDYGISVIHDKTNHSVSYNDSYSRSNETVNRYLKKYGDFKMIIDLHRDSVENKSAVTANINGENVAKLMFVTAKNSTRYGKNSALADELMNNANTLFPGLAIKILTYNHGINGFNEGLSDNSMLIECGANINSSAEAKGSAKYIARLIAEHVNK